MSRSSTARTPNGGRAAPTAPPPRAGGASPFTGRQPVANAIFADPVLVAEIEFAGWTASGMLRHPSYKGLREDVAPAAVVRERKQTNVEVDGRRLSLTNLRKVLYPE